MAWENAEENWPIDFNGMSVHLELRTWYVYDLHVFGIVVSKELFAHSY